MRVWLMGLRVGRCVDRCQSLGEGWGGSRSDRPSLAVPDCGWAEQREVLVTELGESRGLGYEAARERKGPARNRPHQAKITMATRARCQLFW